MKSLFVSFMVFALCVPVVSSGEEYQWEFAGWYGGGAFPNIVYDPNIKDRVYLVSDVAGLYRSDTGGEKWRLITKGLTNVIGATLEISSSDSNLLFAGMKHGLFFSTNAGTSWGKVLGLPKNISFIRPHNYKSITISEIDSDRICIGTAKGHIFCSVNKGKIWTKLNLDSGDIPEGEPIVALQLDDENNGLWLAHGKGLSLYGFDSKKITEIFKLDTGVNDLVVHHKEIFVCGGHRVYTSFDGGRTWKPSESFPEGEVFRIAISNKGIMYAAVNFGWRSKLYSSNDLGQSWKEIARKKDGALADNPTRAWADPFGKVASLKINPFNNDEFMETDWWGVWKSTDQGQSIQEKISGAPNAVGSDIHFSEKGVLFVATMDNGLLKSFDYGKNYEMVFPKQGYSSRINGHAWRVVSSQRGKHIIATSSPWGEKVNQVIVSDDGGDTFDIVRQGLPLTRPTKNTMWHEGYPRALAIDPKFPTRVYLGIDGENNGGLFISDDAGKSWAKSVGQPNSRRIYNGLAVDPTNTNRVVWGASARGGGVYISEDRGETWKLSFDKMKWVFDVEIDINGTIFAMGDYNGAAVFISEDSGKKWIHLHSFPQARAAQSLAIDPNNPNRLAISVGYWGGNSPGAIYLSEDKGKDWFDVTGDLADGSGASSMTFDPKGDFLFANLYAGSIWKLDVSSLGMKNSSGSTGLTARTP